MEKIVSFFIRIITSILLVISLNYSIIAQTRGTVIYQGNWPLTAFRIIEGKGELIFEENRISSFMPIGNYQNKIFNPGTNRTWEDNDDPNKISIRNVQHGDTSRMDYLTTQDPGNIFVDFEKKELLHLVRVKGKDSMTPKDSLVYLSEETGIISWSLYDEQKVIGSHTCQKAKTHFRGREYTAWFTLDIPVNFGPWKLNGLPGLILEVYDSRQEVYFIATTIDIDNKKEYRQCQMPNNYTTIPMKEYQRKAWDEMRSFEKKGEETAQRLQARAPQGVKIAFTIKNTFTGIELDFEFLTKD